MTNVEEFIAITGEYEPKIQIQFLIIWPFLVEILTNLKQFFIYMGPI